MQYYFVEKLEAIEGNLRSTELGYVTKINSVKVINKKAYNSFIDWTIENKNDLENQTISIEACPYLPCYCVRTSTNNINGINIKMIKDLNNLESL